MPNTFETSFIPKQPLLKIEGNSQRRESVNVALVVSLIIFFVTASVAGGLYFWKGKVFETVRERAVELKDAEKNFNIDDINTYKRLQISLDTAKRLVDEHTIFSVAFNIIEDQTAKNIALTSLTYGQEPLGVSLVLSGQAPSYSALYFQVNSWKNMNPLVKMVELTSFVLDEKSGVVTFSVKIILEGSYFRSAQVIQAGEKEQLNTQPSALISAPVPTTASSTVPLNIPVQ